MNILSRSIRPLPCRLAVASTRTFTAQATTNLISDMSNTMPPGHNASVGNLKTFTLPNILTGSEGERSMGRAMVDVWRQDGILQIATHPMSQKVQENAMDAIRGFFRKPHIEKAACVDSQSYSGYISSGEEITDGIADYSEVFTVTKNLALSDPRVRAKWPCHGPCPWPDSRMQEPIEKYIKWLDGEGEKVLRLIEYGLDIPEGSLTKYTQDGWHHARLLRFPPTHLTNGKGKNGRGIGSHTDYGLVVIASQDDVGGLFIRPPYEDEKFANWESSAAGMREEDGGWVYVPPIPNVHTVFLGDMMQYLTNNYLTATPHKVALNTGERLAIAYFHEPSFQAVLEPLEKFNKELHNASCESVHYGTHFTNMCMRNYPDRITTQHLLAENRYSMLKEEELRQMGVPQQ